MDKRQTYHFFSDQQWLMVHTIFPRTTISYLPSQNVMNDVLDLYFEKKIVYSRSSTEKKLEKMSS